MPAAVRLIGPRRIDARSTLTEDAWRHPDADEQRDGTGDPFNGDRSTVLSGPCRSPTGTWFALTTPQRLTAAFVYPAVTQLANVKVRIRKTPEQEELDGVRLDDMKPGAVREVSSSIGSWLIAERYADPEMRRDIRAHEEDFLIARSTALDGVSRTPHRRSNER